MTLCCAKTGRHASRFRAPKPSAQVLVGPQECVPGGGPHLAGLLLHGRHRAAPQHRPAACPHQGDGGEVRVTLHQRVPRWRRQHASADPLQRQRSRRMGTAPRRSARTSLKPVSNWAGRVTGEHGVGIEKINSMCVQFSPMERDAFHAVKRAFDPPGLLNPDKGIRRGPVAPSTEKCTCAAECFRIGSAALLAGHHAVARRFLARRTHPLPEPERRLLAVAGPQPPGTGQIHHNKQTP